MRALSWMIFLFGCQPMDGGAPFQAVPPEECVCDCPECPEEIAAEVPAATEAVEAPKDEADAERPSVGTDGDPFAAALLAQEQEEAAPGPEDVAPAAMTSEPQTFVSNAPLSWGVRLVSVVPGAVPPQAVLGLPNGQSQVVRAGDLLPDVGIVVLAIGVDRVQLAQVKPAGDHAEIDSVQLTAMYPTAQP